MSDDFITGLQRDLVGAMERYERRRLRLPRPGPLVPVAAAAALVVAVILVARTFAPMQPPARPHIVGSITIGGTPMDATLAGGSLWVTDFNGAVIRIDPASRRAAPASCGVRTRRAAA